MAILVTGGAGFIGSHTCVELLNAGYELVVVDNLANSRPAALERVKEITGKTFLFYQVDLLHPDNLAHVFSENEIEAVIHFSGLKAVGESTAHPLHYYHNNITGTLNLCQVMAQYGVHRIVFSSSATVYGLQDQVPFTEDMPRAAINPYGQTKLMIEQILEDLYTAQTEWGVALLRYFNPIGAHKSGWIGEDPDGIPNNLIPYINQVAVGTLPELKVFGDDYPTKDGTGVRDYIHVVDLAIGHLRALEKVLQTSGVHTYNLGTGTGYSVLEMIQAFEKASDKTIPYTITQRRPGDIAVSYADASKAETELGWRAQRGIEEMCEDSWRWQMNNPKGYQ